MAQAGLSVAQHQLQDGACGDCNQNIVRADLNPMVATRRWTQMMSLPVINHEISVSVFERQALAPVKLMFRSSAAFELLLIAKRPNRSLGSILTMTTIGLVYLIFVTILLNHLC